MLARLRTGLLMVAAFAVGSIGAVHGLQGNGTDTYAKRDDSSVELVALDDDDDDDSGDSDDGAGSGSGVSNDATGSGYTSVSHDNDESDPRLAFENDDAHGALRIRLRPGRADLAFVRADGRVLDRSTVRCQAR